MPRNKKPSGDLLTVDELDEMAQDILQMEAYCQRYREIVRMKLEAGVEFKNASLQPKRAMPKWDDAEEVLDLLKKSRLLKRDEFEPRKLMPPGAFKTAMAKELKRENPKPAVLELMDHIKSESSGFNLVIKP